MRSPHIRMSKLQCPAPANWCRAALACGTTSAVLWISSPCTVVLGHMIERNLTTPRLQGTRLALRRLSLLSLFSTAVASPAAAQAPPQFEKDVLPILEKYLLLTIPTTRYDT